MSAGLKIRLSAFAGTFFYLGLVFTAGNLSTGEREDRGNRWVLAAFGILSIVSAYLCAIPTARISGFWTAMRCAGLAWRC